MESVKQKIIKRFHCSVVHCPQQCTQDCSPQGIMTALQCTNHIMYSSPPPPPQMYSMIRSNSLRTSPSLHSQTAQPLHSQIAQPLHNRRFGTKEALHHYIFIIAQLWLTSHPRSTVVLLDTGTPGTSREIFSEDADATHQLDKLNSFPATAFGRVSSMARVLGL